MSEKEEQLIDPPETHGGGKAEMDSPADEEAAAAIDPPSTDGGN